MSRQDKLLIFNVRVPLLLMTGPIQALDRREILTQQPKETRLSLQ
jgi:hypothetical protein